MHWQILAQYGLTARLALLEFQQEGANVASLKKVMFRGREDKMAEVGHLLHYLTGEVLDVGCDVKYLSKMVQGYYVGLDISGVPDVQANIEYGLPFQQKSFDAVVAFDVLEHCDRIHFVFDELCRVSRQYVVIGLPNIYEWHFRLSFIVGNRLSGKYGLACEPPSDRHRWLFTLSEAMNFVKQRGFLNGFSVIDEAFVYYKYRRLVPRLVTMMGRRISPTGASLFAYSYWVVLGSIKT
jgi:Methyltransferase domain